MARGGSDNENFNEADLNGASAADGSRAQPTKPDVRRLARQLVDAAKAGRPFYAFTGAGISTDSGLPDFRSPGGLWTAEEAERASSATGFRKDPSKVWELFVDGFYEANPQPNAGHKALARLQELGLISDIVTQNVDTLHQDGGSPDASVHHLHGDLKHAICLDCFYARELPDAYQERLQTGQVPTCPTCTQPLQPSLTLFEQDLPPRAWKAADKLSYAAGGVLVVGSSLVVTPAAYIPLQTGRSGAPVAILNIGNTEMDHNLDPDTDVRIRRGSSETLVELVEAAEAMKLSDAHDQLSRDI